MTGSYITFGRIGKRDQTDFLSTAFNPIDMDDVAMAPPTSLPMADTETSPSVLEPGAPVPMEAPPEPAELENACETLYIQNLNEKIKPEGLYYTFLSDLLDSCVIYVSQC